MKWHDLSEGSVLRIKFESWQDSSNEPYYLLINKEKYRLEWLIIDNGNKTSNFPDENSEIESYYEIVYIP